MPYEDQYGSFFGRITDDGVAILHIEDGAPATRLDASVYPVGQSASEARSARYEFPEGIVLSFADARSLGMDIEGAMQRAYAVEGRWPFPLDMLRRDQAKAATPADQTLIDRMSGSQSDEEFGTRTKVRINLLMESSNPTRGRPEGRWLPNHERWESFGWTVHGVAEIDERRAFEEAMRAASALRESALAKLTPDERRALGL